MSSPSPSPSSDTSSPPLLASSFPPVRLDAADSSAQLRPPLPPAVAGWALRKAVAHGLSQAGFEGAEEEAYMELEGAVYEYFGALLTYASQLAELGRRHEPTLRDVVQASWELGVGGAGELVREIERGREKGEEAPDIQITYKRPRLPSPPPRLLPSDDESDPLPPHLLSPPPSPPQSPAGSEDEDEDADFEEVLPLGPDGQPLPSAVAEQGEKKKRKEEKREKKKREKEERGKERERRRRLRRKREEADPFRAGWLPGLPPKHSWKQTPVYPQSSAPPPIPPPISHTQQAPSALALQHLSTLRARLNDSQLVAASLRNLIRRTGARAVAPAGAGGAEGQGQEEREQQEALLQEAQDVVDYESEWYGVKEASAAALVIPGSNGGGGKRRIRVLTVGADKEDDVDEEGEEREKREREQQQGEGSRVGGAAKRRRWLV